MQHHETNEIRARGGELLAGIHTSCGCLGDPVAVQLRIAARMPCPIVAPAYACCRAPPQLSRFPRRRCPVR